MNWMVHVSSTMWKIKNQPSNSTSSCSDNALHLLGSCDGQIKLIEDFKWCLHFQSGVAFWKAILRDVYFEGPNWHLKGIEDFNLEQHWLKSARFREMVWREVAKRNAACRSPTDLRHLLTTEVHRICVKNLDEKLHRCNNYKSIDWSEWQSSLSDRPPECIPKPSFVDDIVGRRTDASASVDLGSRAWRSRDDLIGLLWSGPSWGGGGGSH